MKNKKGFTLIELLASITILLLLFTIAVPTSLNLIEKSNKDHCEKMANTIEANAELCVLDKNSVCYDKTEINLIDLYNNGYIDAKYENKHKNETLTNDNNFKDYIITITTKATTGDNAYSIYELKDSSYNNPCE